MKSFYYTTAVVFLSLALNSGCSVSKLLVGQVSPVDEKSNSIQITALETLDPSWKRVEITDDLSPNDMPDRAWQSTKTASVVSLNSACRQGSDDQNYNDMGLKEITKDMLSQWRDLDPKSERDFKLSGFPALETTAEGFYFNSKRKIQTVVVKTPTCVYDLIFLAQPKNFAQDLAVFQKFRDKLILK